MADTPTLLKYLVQTKRLDDSFYPKNKAAPAEQGRRRQIDSTLEYIECTLNPLIMRIQKLVFQKLFLQQEKSKQAKSGAGGQKTQAEEALNAQIALEFIAYNDYVLQNLEDRLQSLNKVEMKRGFSLPAQAEQLQQQSMSQVIDGIQDLYGMGGQIDFNCLNIQEVFVAGGENLSIADIYLASSIMSLKAMDKLLLLSDISAADSQAHYTDYEKGKKAAMDLKYPCVSLWLQNMEQERLFAKTSAALDKNFIEPFLQNL